MYIIYNKANNDKVKKNKKCKKKCKNKTLKNRKKGGGYLMISKQLP